LTQPVPRLRRLRRRRRRHYRAREASCPSHPTTTNLRSCLSRIASPELDGRPPPPTSRLTADHQEALEAPFGRAAASTLQTNLRTRPTLLLPPPPPTGTRRRRLERHPALVCHTTRTAEPRAGKQTKAQEAETSTTPPPPPHRQRHDLSSRTKAASHRTPARGRAALPLRASKRATILGVPR
jgi:hypothetical protein